LRVIAQSALIAFWRKPGRGDAEGPLKAWYAEVKKSTWTIPMDIKARYSTASFLADNRVVFNIGGNKYRLVTVVHYPKRVYIRWIGTHGEYDKIDAAKV
jgi:mRNA interferase HigB